MSGVGSNYVLNLPFAAEAALTKFRFVKGGSTDKGVTPVTGITDLAVGVNTFDITTQQATDGAVAGIAVLGTAVVEAAAAISAYAEVAPSANGRAQTAVTTQRVAGIALQAAGGAGEWITVLLTPAGRLVP